MNLFLRKENSDNDLTLEKKFNAHRNFLIIGSHWLQVGNQLFIQKLKLEASQNLYPEV
jgi:hypothetical protein